MRTVKQVSALTGISVRTLQYYDEIGLFKPTKVTEAGYRLYDDASLGSLQQILFFKELDFSLQEIKAIMENPNFDKAEAFRKQKALIQMKRDQLDRLLHLLEELEKGEKRMSLQEFDMSEYFQALDDFKKTHTEEITKKLGSIEPFEEMVTEMKASEANMAKLAIQQYGSIENYIKASQKNWEAAWCTETEPADVEQSIERTDALTQKLTADRSRNVSSKEVQDVVRELVDFCTQCSPGQALGEDYWAAMANQYLTNPVFIRTTDKKYGQGASDFIGRALKAYLE